MFSSLLRRFQQRCAFSIECGLGYGGHSWAVFSRPPVDFRVLILDVYVYSLYEHCFLSETFGMLQGVVFIENEF